MQPTRGPVRASNISFFPLIVFVSLTLAACGGSNDSSYSAPTSTSNAPPATTAAAPTVSLSLQPTTITAGQSATLTWSSTNAGTCTASGAWSGSQPTSGRQTVTPSSSGGATYTLTCTSTVAAAGNAVMTATLTVNPTTAYAVTDLVSDGTGAHASDVHLINPWGLVFGPTNPVWVANNGSQTSTVYDGHGIAFPSTGPLVVSMPAANFNPTGIVYNGSTDFVATKGSNSKPSTFIFAGEGGMIAGWARPVDPTHAVAMYTDTKGARYTGLAIANNASGNFLYAADFANGKIDVFNATFVKQTPTASSFAFVDPTLPAHFAPFGIQAIKNGTGGATQLYVSYAPQVQDGSEAGGAGMGLIDIFDTNGNFIKHLVPVGGALNAPWGMALAPADFGALSKMLLVGNFGDGRINAYDPGAGTFVATVTTDTNGTPFTSSSLWAIAFGNDNQSQPHNTLFFTAGPGGGSHGLYGRVDPPAGSAASSPKP